MDPVVLHFGLQLGHFLVVVQELFLDAEGLRVVVGHSSFQLFADQLLPLGDVLLVTVARAVNHVDSKLTLAILHQLGVTLGVESICCLVYCLVAEYRTNIVVFWGFFVKLASLHHEELDKAALTTTRWTTDHNVDKFSWKVSKFALRVFLFSWFLLLKLLIFY